MAPEFEQVKDLVAILRDIVTVIAVVAAGIWALHTFRALGAVQKAKAEITKLEREAAEEPVLQVDLRARSNSLETGGPRTMLISAKFRNEGKRALEFGTPLLAIYRRSGADAKAGGAWSQRDTAVMIDDNTGEIAKMPPRVLRSAQARTIAFAVEVPSTGYYLLQLTTLYHGLVMKNGRFKKSNDVPVIATEQLAVSIS